MLCRGSLLVCFSKLLVFPFSLLQEQFALLKAKSPSFLSFAVCVCVCVCVCRIFLVTGKSQIIWLADQEGFTSNKILVVPIC
jgi:hypothetical protein